MDKDRLLQMLTYYKQTLADVLEENFLYKATVKELSEEIQKLKEKLKTEENPE